MTKADFRSDDASVYPREVVVPPFAKSEHRNVACYASLSFPSFPSLASPAIDSEQSGKSVPSASTRCMSASGKHSFEGSGACGSPPTIKLSTRSSRPSFLKNLISWLTQSEFAELGEQTTTK